MSTMARSALGETRAGGVASSRSTITTVAWIAGCDLGIAEWARQGQRLGIMDRCSPWWIGDWIRYGNERFGQKYTRAAKITGYDVQTLMNRVYVASRYEISRRRESLSWSHHDALAALAAEQQECWLDRAVSHRMSVADLRLELRARRHDAERTAKPEQMLEQSALSIRCPNCGHPISSPAFSSWERPAS